MAILATLSIHISCFGSDGFFSCWSLVHATCNETTCVQRSSKRLQIPKKESNCTSIHLNIVFVKLCLKRKETPNREAKLRPVFYESGKCGNEEYTGEAYFDFNTVYARIALYIDYRMQWLTNTPEGTLIYFERIVHCKDLLFYEMSFHNNIASFRCLF